MQIVRAVVVGAVCIPLRVNGDAAQGERRVHLRRGIVELKPRRDVDRWIGTVRFSEHHFLVLCVVFCFGLGGGV